MRRKPSSNLQYYDCDRDLTSSWKVSIWLFLICSAIKNVCVKRSLRCPFIQIKKSKICFWSIQFINMDIRNVINMQNAFKMPFPGLFCKRDFLFVVFLLIKLCLLPCLKASIALSCVNCPCQINLVFMGHCFYLYSI